MRSHPLSSLSVIVVAGLAAASGGPIGCSTLTESAANLLISPADEVALGVELAGQVEQELVIHPDPDVQAFMQAMGSEIVAVLPADIPAEYNFQFHVVDDDETINAFAAPGGQIYFYTGLLLAAENQAEVMGVLGHEIAHVTERHGAEQLVTQFGIESVLGLALGNSSGDLLGTVASLATTGALLKYSRDHESEADEVGLRYVINAGYDPYAFVGFFERLEAMQGVRLPDFLSTHPDPGDRAARIRQLIPTYGDVPTFTGDEVVWAEFLARL